MGLQWKKGQKELPPNIDPLIARAFSDPLSIPPEFLTWLKARLELEPPEFITPDMPPPSITAQKIIEWNEVDIGQETDLDFLDGDISAVRRPVVFTVTNTPGVRDVVQGRVETRFVNPGDIEIDPALAPYIELDAGATDFSITDTSLSVILDTTYIPVGRVANFHAGFALQVAVAYSNIVYADNCAVRAYTDDNAGPSSPSILNNASWDLPGGGAYNGLYTTGWKTIQLPYGTGSATDYVFIRAGGEPYLDVFASTFEGTVYFRWVYMPGGEQSAYIEMGMPTPPSGQEDDYNVVQWNPASGGWETVNETFVVGRIGARLNSGGSEYQRQRINFIEGAGIDLTIADDSANEEIDVTVATALSGRFNGLLYGTPTVGTTRFLMVPRGTNDAAATFNLDRIRLRTETPSSSGSVTAVLQMSAGGEAAPSWTDIQTLTLPSGEYEVEYTLNTDVDSGELLRLYFTGIGTGCTDYQALIMGDRTA